MKKIIKIFLRESFSFFIFYSGIYLLYIFLSRKRIVILNYHDINAGDFERHIRYLSRRFNIISLKQCADNLKLGKLRENALVITFDDGYQSFYRDIFPILKKYNVPAAVFLTTGYIDSDRIFWFDMMKMHFLENGTQLFEEILGIKEGNFDSIISYINRLDESEKNRKVEEIIGKVKIESADKIREYQILTWAQIKEMNSGLVCFGAHTVSHPVLSRVSPDTARKEISESKRQLEKKLSAAVEFFAYPFGSESDFNDEVIELVRKAGFACALTTVNGDCEPGDNLFSLKRKVVDGGFSIPSLAAKISGLWIPLTRKWI